MKKPFSVLHTQNFSNIRQSYTPRCSNTSKKNVVLTGYNKQASCSNLEAENVAPNGEVSADVTHEISSPLATTTEQPTSSTPAEGKSEGMTKQQSKHRNSVRRSTTFTKIGLTEDTPDRTTVLLSNLSPSVSRLSPPTSDTKFASLASKTTTEACEKLSASIVNKLDFESVEESYISENVDVETAAYNTTPAKLSQHSITSACISPNTFVRENFAAISTPDQAKFLEQEMMTHVFKSSEKSIEVFRGSTITRSDTTGSEIQIGESITMHTMTQTFTQNTITMATPPTNRSRGFTSQIHVSPMSFFRDSMSNTPDNLSVTSVSNKVPSPGMVLNNSVPHEIMVRQLGYVRKSLTGGELPPTDWKSSPLTAGADIPVFTKGKSDGKQRRSLSAVAKSKTRRRSGTKSTHQKKLFSDIPDCQSPRRTTFLVNNKAKSGKPASSVQRFQKAGSKVIGKVMSAVNKTKAKRKSLDAKPRSENPIVVFSPHADSPNIVAKPLEAGDESNPSRLTIVVRKPKVLKSAKQKKENSLVPPSKGKNDPLSPVQKKPVCPVVDSTTVTKAKPDVGEKNSDKSVATTSESKAIELFPVSPVRGAKVVSPDRCVETDIGSPQALPTSPHPETTRRGTMTVTKHKPSEALMKSSLSGKSLFEKMLNSPVTPHAVSWSNSTPEPQQASASKSHQCLSDKKASGDNNSTFDQSMGSDALSKISLEYVCSSDSGSSTNGTPELSASGAGDGSQPVMAAVKLAKISEAIQGSTQDSRHYQKQGTTSENSLVSEVKKTSPAVDREERFICRSNVSIQYTPARCEAGIEKQRILRRQLATTDMDTQEGNCTSAYNVVTSQKKRYHSDSSAVLNRTNPERLGKRPKVSEVPKTRMRRATDSSIKTGEIQKFCLIFAIQKP